MTLPAGFARICLNYTGAGAPHGACVVYCVDNAGDAPATELGNEAISSWSIASVKGMMTNDVTLSSVLVKKGPDASGASALVTASVTSSYVANTPGPAVCKLVHKHTALGGRRGRGRMYLPAVDEAVIDDGGNITGATITADNTALGLLMTNLVSLGTPMVLEHSPPTEWVLVNGQPRRVPIAGAEIPAPTVVTGLTLDAKVATQRRRLRG